MFASSTIDEVRFHTQIPLMWWEWPGLDLHKFCTGPVICPIIDSKISNGASYGFHSIEQVLNIVRNWLPSLKRTDAQARVT